MGKRHAPIGMIWFYPACSTKKRGYYGRADARAAAKATPNRGKLRLTAYLCEECGFWHIGHIPTQVKNGDLDRRDLERNFYQRKPRRT